MKRIPIAKKLLITVLTTSAAMSALLTVAQIAFEYREKKSELNSVIKGIESSLLPGVARQMWDYDVTGISTPFDNLLTSSDLAHVKITFLDGKVVLDKGKPDFVPRYPILVSFPIIYSDKSKNEAVGHVDLTFYSDRIVDEIKFHFITLLGFNLVKTLIVASILIHLFARIVTKPLTDIVQYIARAKSLPESVEPEPMNINRGPSAPDEISDLIDFVWSRERQVYSLQKKLRDKLDVQAKVLEETDLALRNERMRAEMNARMVNMAEMASGVAHEINNPLAIISGYLFAIKAEVKKPSHKEDAIIQNVDKAEKTVTRMAKIVSGLRTFARDASNDPMKPVALNDMIQKTLNLLESKIRGSGIEFTFEGHCHDQLSINCRESQIIQTIAALISNAYEATKEREHPWIKITTSTSVDFALIRVSDSGPGIPTDVGDKIFHPFFTTKSVGHGAGLGLSVGLGVSKDHGGDLIHVPDSDATTFELKLPYIKAAISA